MTPKLETFHALVAAAREQHWCEAVCIDWRRAEALCANLNDGGGVYTATLGGDRNEFLLLLFFSAVNYRFVNLGTGERPAVKRGPTMLTGSMAFEHDLRELLVPRGLGTDGLNWLSTQLTAADWSPGVRAGICDLPARVMRLRYLADRIIQDCDELDTIHERGDLDAALQWAWRTGLYIDPFYKRLQHLAFAWMRRVAAFHAHLPRLSCLTTLCDYRLPELLLECGAITVEGGVPADAEGAIRLRESDPLAGGLRAASCAIGFGLSRRTGHAEIVIDHYLWRLSRSISRRYSLLVDTDSF